MTENGWRDATREERDAAWDAAKAAAKGALGEGYSARARRRVLSAAEMGALLDALKAHETPAHLAGFVALSIYTGQRGVHIKALRWEHVDLDGGMLYFTRSNPAAAENKQTADVPIAKALRPHLEALQKLARTPYVIEWDDKPVTSLKRSWAGLLRRAGIADLRIHDP